MINEKYINKIIHSDCLDIMRNIKDNSIELILTDPPYGIKQNIHKIKSRTKLAATNDYDNFSWDDNIPGPEYFKEMLRISKNQIIFGGNYFTNLLPPSSCWLVWDKVNQGSSFADCELAWTSFKKACRLFSFMWNGMLQGASILDGKRQRGNKKLNVKRIHPTQKPIELFIWILLNYSKDNDLICDPFSGSGTTAISCYKMKRRFICIEKEKIYFDLSNERLKIEQSKYRLKF